LLLKSANTLHLLSGPRTRGEMASSLRHWTSVNNGATWTEVKPIVPDCTRHIIGFNAIAYRGSIAIVCTLAPFQEPGHHSRNLPLVLGAMRSNANGNVTTLDSAVLGSGSPYFQPCPAITLSGDTTIVVGCVVETETTDQPLATLHVLSWRPNGTPGLQLSLRERSTLNSTVNALVLMWCGDKVIGVCAGPGGIMAVSRDRFAVAQPFTIANLSANIITTMILDDNGMLLWLDSRLRIGAPFPVGSHNSEIAPGMGDVQILSTASICRAGPSAFGLRPRTMRVPGSGAAALAVAQTPAGTVLVCTGFSTPGTTEEGEKASGVPYFRLLEPGQ